MRTRRLWLVPSVPPNQGHDLRPVVATRVRPQILVAPHQHGFLAADLIELAFFPLASGSRSSRLVQQQHHGQSLS